MSAPRPATMVKNKPDYLVCEVVNDYRFVAWVEEGDAGSPKVQLHALDSIMGPPPREGSSDELSVFDVVGARTSAALQPNTPRPSLESIARGMVDDLLVDLQLAKQQRRVAQEMENSGPDMEIGAEEGQIGLSFG